MKAIPNAGTYAAALAGPMVVYYPESGSTCVAIPVKLLSGDVQWQGKHTITLENAQGEQKEKAKETLAAIFEGWDKQNPFWLEDQDFSTVEFEVVGEHEAYTPPGETEEVMTFKIKWINPKGGSTKMPEKIDRTAWLAAHGAKWKAAAGGSKPATSAKAAAKPAATTKPKSPGPSSRPPGPPAAAAKTSSLQECWDKLLAVHNPDNDKSEAEIGTIWWAELAKVKPNSGGQLTDEQWGQVMSNLEA